jgi:hypothetical protein
MGDAASTAHLAGQVGSVVTSGATAALGAIAAHLAATGGSIVGLSGAALTAAIPIVGVALASATMLAQYLIANSGCGQTCIVTSQWANQAADALQQNLDAYFALPTPRTKTQQALALANFDTIWNQLRQMCGQQGNGDAGVRCISDRQRGACVWHQNKQPQYPGQAQIGECFDWFNGYRDPISKDPVVSDATTSVSQGIESIFGGGSSSVSNSSLVPIALFAGLIFLGMSLK